MGLAPGARLWAVKVLDNSGQGFDSDIIAGIDYITANAGEIDVANLSWGGDGPDEALHTAIKNSVAAGVTYVLLLEMTTEMLEEQYRPISRSNNSFCYS